MHVIQTLNGNKGNAHFVSGKMKELNKKCVAREETLMERQALSSHVKH